MQTLELNADSTFNIKVRDQVIDAQVPFVIFRVCGIPLDTLIHEALNEDRYEHVVPIHWEIFSVDTYHS